MRTIALSLVALLAAPTVGRAQGAVARPPARPMDAGRPSIPTNGVRLESRPAPATRPGYAPRPGYTPPTGFGSGPGSWPHRGYERPRPVPVEPWQHRRDPGYGPGRRTARPRVIVVEPYGAYGYGAYGYGAYDTYFGSGYTTGSYGSGYTGSYAPPSTRPVESQVDEETTDVDDEYEPPAPTRVLVVPAATPAAASIAVERVAGSLIRLRWTGHEAGVREVALVVADASRRVLATQTVREAPYSAVFENAGRVAFVGTTVVRADGVSTMTLVPLARALAATASGRQVLKATTPPSTRPAPR